MTKLIIKKCKRVKRVFANFTAPELHLVIDMAEVLNEELGTTVRLLAMASIKACLQLQNKAAKDLIFAFLGKSTRRRMPKNTDVERIGNETVQGQGDTGQAGV